MSNQFDPKIGDIIIENRATKGLVTEVTLELGETSPEEVENQVALAEVQAIIDEYGISFEEASIAHERQKVYGDPKINHDGIAQAWAGLLQPYAIRIARMDPLPAHVVALMMAALKMNRMRMVFHEDNYADLSVYVAFAQAWQRDDEADTTVIGPKPSPGARLVLRWEEEPSPVCEIPLPPHLALRPSLSMEMTESEDGIDFTVAAKWQSIEAPGSTPWYADRVIVCPSRRISTEDLQALTESLLHQWIGSTGIGENRSEDQNNETVVAMVEDLKNK